MSGGKEEMKTAEEVVEKTSDSVTRWGKYKRDGACLFEDQWVELEKNLAEALLAERRKAYEDAIEAIKAMKYDPHCAHEQYCYCSEGLISQREAEIEIRRRMEGVC